MKKTLCLLGGWAVALSSYAFTTQHYQNDNASQALRGFHISSDQNLKARGAPLAAQPTNELLAKSVEKYSPSIRQYTTSYYQYYHGVRVLDGEISVRETKASGLTGRNPTEKRVIGQLVQGIDIELKELEALKSKNNLQQALADAKAHFFHITSDYDWTVEVSEANVVIKNEEGKLRPLYETRFYATAKKHMPVLFHALLDPNQKNKVVKAWNDVMHYSDTGPGGNTKTKEYHYGVDGIPGLNVNKKKPTQCELNDPSAHMIVVNMNDISANASQYDWYMQPFNYRCQSEVRDKGPSYGAFSPADDAYFFGHLVQKVYQDWYQTKVLDLKTVTLRVHYQIDEGEPFENAFWDPVTQTMNFGDGSSEGTEEGLYPLVSIDVAGHEMSHGFTSAHSNLQYHDESGALNEAFSDMAGVATVAYMQQNNPLLYKAIYHTDQMSWTIGSTIMRSAKPNAAMRYLDRPSQDGVSADCYKKIRGADKCLITYDDVVKFSHSITDEENYRQGIIVHLGSGVYNKFFYILSHTPGWDVKKAFGLMLTCNRDGYWGENTNFQTAACQTVQAATDIGYDTVAVQNAFTRVGIDTAQCKPKLN